jgi:hypothetical protein
MPSDARLRSFSHKRRTRGDGHIATTDDDPKDEQRMARLPREVRAIRRLLDKHEQSSDDTSTALSAMQGEMSRMTQMMAALVTSMSYASAAGVGAVDNPALPTTQRHPLSTPPPPPHVTLSPILEGTTPAAMPCPPSQLLPNSVP